MVLFSPTGTRFRILLIPGLGNKILAQPVQQRIAPLHPGGVETSDGLDAPLPDDFWLGKE
jgi:hypothetical protein